MPGASSATLHVIFRVTRTVTAMHKHINTHIHLYNNDSVVDCLHYAQSGYDNTCTAINKQARRCTIKHLQDKRPFRWDVNYLNSFYLHSQFLYIILGRSPGVVLGGGFETRGATHP
ncbi:hypothetical protein NP493_1119g00039 [Ridgeia piscesae]|uniref:Uncharacterized protein n=1 Tax=Ridgeia piscesae TaxID=27915 RepID=A0AAD9NJM9_RIDPI|nr:hypothetical protein NP493_1119g00039 [Ridgeia piscesae]